MGQRRLAIADDDVGNAMIAKMRRDAAQRGFYLG